ncbi:hypothetical protein SODALDRAFT_50999 [Sodiomyces alkalinus F11]|uniref:Uncharacterized protein n=1 Tax=Sodiomyces alkalinus (strain CBS 110278 / VKM F-3762 / F11) TaxID=1314773 RepID=A0A3N2PMY1_SODAK|nr:hypothetical protein SODALDRAFT_50999 [Sodiomyces alkalinus F11]ROT35774.1 hypothetical protein SODALDRAFT_50999 [Sodiomyces alkalinus F11]
MHSGPRHEVYKGSARPASSFTSTHRLNSINITLYKPISHTYINRGQLLHFLLHFHPSKTTQSTIPPNMTPFYDILARRQDSNDTHQRHITTIFYLSVTLAPTIVVLVLVILSLCIWRRRTAKYDLRRREEWDRERAIHRGEVLSLNRRLRCCTCNPALPWEDRGNANTQQRAPGNDPTPAVQPSRMSSDEGIRLTFMRDSFDLVRPPLDDAGNQGEPGTETFIIGDDESDESNHEEDVPPARHGLSPPPVRDQRVTNRPPIPNATSSVSDASGRPGRISETFGARPVSYRRSEDRLKQHRPWWSR